LLLIQQLLNRRGGSAPVDTREVLQIQQRIGGAKALVLVVAPAGDPVPLLLYCYEPTLQFRPFRAQHFQLCPVVPAEHVAGAIVDGTTIVLLMTALIRLDLAASCKRARQTLEFLE